jgi:hypothetical protein
MINALACLPGVRSLVIDVQLQRPGRLLRAALLLSQIRPRGAIETGNSQRRPIIKVNVVDLKLSLSLS